MIYHYFEIDGGNKFKLLKGNFYGNPYSFKNNIVKFNLFTKCIYLLGKVWENIYIR